MYRISYEKCVCFIFLVILAILSCSGVRIDNLAMTDINKRNSHTSSSSLLNSDNRFFLFNTSTPTFRHRIRHHRQLRAQAHTTRPTPFNEPFAQIPSTDVTQIPTKSHVQRSTKNNKQKKKRKQKCPDYDITWKFCQANTVVQAKYESKSSSCKQNCTMLFKVVKTLKPSKFPIDDRIPINLPLKKEKSTCDYDDLVHRSKFLVRTEINQSTEYILFLDAYGAHNFSAVFAPEPIKNRTPSQINKLIKLKCHQREGFLGKNPRNHTANPKKLRFVCKVKGRPIPIIYWEKDGVLIQPSNSPHLRITHKKRRSSLVIRKPTEADSGRYECVARGLNGKVERQHFDYKVRPCNPDLKNKCRGTCLIRISQMREEEFCVCPGGGEKCRKGEPNLSSHLCGSPYNSSYCQNGGTCFDATGSYEFSCVCPEGYGGARCETKQLNTSSMYRQTPKYTCSEGIYTKYDNCR